MKKQENNKLKKSIIIIGTLFLIAWLTSSTISLFSGPIQQGNVAIIPIKGMILSDQGDFLAKATTSTSVKQKIEKAATTESIKAVIFEINSPGGTPVASEEIAKAIEELNKTKIAWIRETGASGAYWAAAATNHIIASKLSIVGSIGVYSSYLELSGLLEDHNISYTRIVGGEYKDLGSPLKELTTEERILIQTKIDLMHEYFLSEIIRLRNLTQTEEIKTGVFYTGIEAEKIGLIDQIGTEKEAIKYLEKELNTTIKTISYEDKKTILDTINLFLKEQSYYLGAGMTNFLKQKQQLITT